MGQQTLLGLQIERREPEAVRIPGFRLHPDYINVHEEQQLLHALENGPWQNDYRRRIQQYGLGYGAVDAKDPAWVRDFPDWLLPLAKRIAAEPDFARFPDNCVINEYVPPQGIAPHRDYAAFGPAVACVSLGSDILMDFLAPETRRRVPVFVPARSLWVISADARSHWMHGIAPRLNDIIDGEKRRRTRRVSITFRTASTAE